MRLWVQTPVSPAKTKENDLSETAYKRNRPESTTTVYIQGLPLGPSWLYRLLFPLGWSSSGTHANSTSANSPPLTTCSPATPGPKHMWLRTYQENHREQWTTSAWHRKIIIFINCCHL
jgi:hypothetical protein